eukprot:SAG22_NODE_229_length_14598_cov_13.257052_9_plen_56_part_00
MYDYGIAIERLANEVWWVEGSDLPLPRVFETAVKMAVSSPPTSSRFAEKPLWWNP